MPSFNGFIVDKLNHLGGIWQQTTWSKISCLIFQFLNLWRQSWCAEKKREVPFVIFISFLNFSWFYWHSTPVVGTILCMKMNIRSQWFLKKKLWWKVIDFFFKTWKPFRIYQHSQWGRLWMTLEPSLNDTGLDWLCWIGGKVQKYPRNLKKNPLNSLLCQNHWDLRNPIFQA